jgi:hypothetical protein
MRGTSCLLIRRECLSRIMGVSVRPRRLTEDSCGSLHGPASFTPSPKCSREVESPVSLMLSRLRRWRGRLGIFGAEVYKVGRHEEIHQMKPPGQREECNQFILVLVRQSAARRMVAGIKLQQAPKTLASCDVALFALNTPRRACWLASPLPLPMIQ